MMVMVMKSGAFNEVTLFTQSTFFHSNHFKALMGERKQRERSAFGKGKEKCLWESSVFIQMENDTSSVREERREKKRLEKRLSSSCSEWSNFADAEVGELCTDIKN
jgi:hypothetical protein